VLHEWFALNRYDAARIKHPHGPFYAIRYRSRKHPGKQLCLKVDVSSVYKEGAGIDRFWQTNGFFTDQATEAQICDF
jgi:hypothetical protein